MSLQSLRLGQRARKPIEEPVDLGHGFQLARDEADHGGVGHEVAFVDERLGLLAERSPILNVGAKQVAGADVLKENRRGMYDSSCGTSVSSLAASPAF